MRPLPQMPTAGASSMVRNVGSQVASSMKTSSMAPGEARMPLRTPPPSKAGPAEQAHESSQSLLPSTISPLVPMSMNSVSFSVAYMPGRDDAGGDVAAHVAAHGRQDVHAGHRVGVAGPSSSAMSLGAAAIVGMYGSSRRYARLQAEEQVRHRRVAGDGDLVDLAQLDAVAPLQLLEQVVDGLDGELLQPLEAAACAWRR